MTRMMAVAGLLIVTLLAVGFTVARVSQRRGGQDVARVVEEIEALLTYKVMEDSPELMGMWIRTEMDGVSGDRYFRRIVVEPACLACHGAKDERPQFVVDGYPDDRAYGFKVGDLRGVYSVFVAD